MLGKKFNRKSGKTGERMITSEQLLKEKTQLDEELKELSDVIKKLERERTAIPAEEKIPFMSRVKKFFGG